MRTAHIVGVAPVVLTLAIAGCGGSSKSSPSKAAAHPTSTPATTSSSAAGKYGQSTSSSRPTATSAALIVTKHDKLGTILAYGPKRLTVYLFEADKGKHSTCAGACATVWPPVTGTPKARGGAISAHLGTITRSDGTKQVTYDGHPLYRYIKDKDDEDTYGQDINSFGADWYALRRSGEKAEVS